MKTKVFFLITLLSTVFSGVFAQIYEDSITELTTLKVADVVSTPPDLVSFGYHPGNYKHPVKAKQSKQLFSVRASINRKAVITNYKRPLKHTEIVDKTIVNEQPVSKKSYNYKRPYSNN